MMEPASATLPTPAPEGAWAAVRAALGGAQVDYTRVSLGRALVLLAIPMVLEMSMESLFALVDITFVSRLGDKATATVGLTESVLYLVYALGMGLAMAVGALVARRVGEGNRDAASRATAQALWLTLAVAVPLGIGGCLGARPILRLLGGDEQLIAQGWHFTAIMLGASAIVLLLFVLNGALRGAGDALAALRVLVLANILNVVLDACLIRGLGPFPRLGLTGAAVATTIGRGTGVAYQIYTLLRGKGRVWLKRATAALDLRLTAHLFFISLGSTGQFLIGNVSWLALMRLMSPFGSPALAGYTVAIRIVMVALLPAWGMSNAAATLVGQNLGARQPERAEASVWRIGLYNAMFLGLVALVFITSAERLVRLLTEDPLVLPYAVSCLRTLAYGYVFYAYGMVMFQSFNGAGDTTTPAILNVVCFWLIQAPLAYALAYPLHWGPKGVFSAITLANSMSAVLGVLAFRRGRWKRQAV